MSSQWLPQSAPSSLTAIFSWWEWTMVFLAFLSIDEEVTSCSSRNSGKGPPEPEFTGDLRGAPNQGRHPRPLEIGAKQRDRVYSERGLNEFPRFKKDFICELRREWQNTFSTRMHQQNSPYIWIVVAWTLSRNYGTSYWSWLVPACWEFSFLSRPDPFLDRLLKHLIPHVLSEPPTHSMTCLWLQPFPEKGERRESPAPVYVTNRTTDGPEFILHYVVDISIDPKNWLSVVSHLFCSYLKWC